MSLDENELLHISATFSSDLISLSFFFPLFFTNLYYFATTPSSFSSFFRCSQFKLKNKKNKKTQGDDDVMKPFELDFDP